MESLYADLLQRELASFNQRRLRPPLPHEGGQAERAEETRWRIQEEQFLDAFRRPIAERARRAPADPDGFVAWFEELRASGPGQGDPLFPWLETTATMREMRWFLTQEVAGGGGVGELGAPGPDEPALQPPPALGREYCGERGGGGGPGGGRPPRALGGGPPWEGARP